MQPSNPADERPSDDEKDEQAREWLESRGYIVQSPDDWRETPPDAPGWWWRYHLRAFMPYSIFESPDGSCFHVFRGGRPSMPVSEISGGLWLKARYPTPTKGE